MFKTFKFLFIGFPVKADDLPRKRRLTDDLFNDPRPEHLRDVAGYADRVQNMVLNYCAETSDNITFRNLIKKANIQVNSINYPSYFL
jgi:hypothetical protein